MSQNSAPSSRMASSSSTRARIWTRVAFMLAHQCFNPRGVPVVQAGVVAQGELLAGAAAAAQVGAALDGVALARRERQADHLGVAGAAGGPLPRARNSWSVSAHSSPLW